MKSSWLARSTLTTKLVAIVAVFVAVIGSVLGLFTLVHEINAGVRAYVGGEGLWSKGQKDAVYALSRYLETGNEREWRDYLAAIALPLGDRKARLEMEKPVFDPAVVRVGFVEGGNSAEDVPQMIFLFRRLGSMPFLSQAIVIWREAEQELLRLEPLAAQVRTLRLAGPLSEAQKQDYLAKIQDINARVTPLEQQFSQLLGAGAREVQALLRLITLASAGALAALGALFAWSISRDFRTRIRVLREGVVRVAMGVLTEPIPMQASDELGELASAFNDMTASRRRAETALKNANDFRERVMENATNAIYTFDRDGHFTSANRRTCEVTGYSLSQLLGLHWREFVPAADYAEIQQGFASTLAGGPPIIQREVAVQRADGQTVQLSFSTAPLTRDGVVVGVVGTAEDITARKAAESQLVAHALELGRSNRELEHFAYVASHDLQEPLRTVSGFAQLLTRRYQGRLDGDADEYLGYITDGVARMKSLIEDLLAYSRVQRAETPPAPIPLDRVMDTALANLAGAIAAAGATIHRTPLPTLPVDAAQFAQLFQNLIGNAIKFRSSTPPVIDVEAQCSGPEWRFRIRDNGIGITAGSIERVFDLFQRGHTREQDQGNGIGLTICKKIVELHGGHIWVAPREDGASGCQFCFTLPLPASP